MRAPRFSVVMLALALTTPPAYADFWSDAVGILTDPLKLGKSSENLIHTVERAFIHAERLEGRVNKDVEARLAQIDTTISDTRQWFTAERIDMVDQVEEAVASSLTRISELEKAFFADTKDLVKCSGIVTADTMRSLLANSLNDLGQRKPRFVIFGKWTVGEVKIDAADIPSPIKGFRQAKALYEKLISEVSESDSPSAITDSYAEIQRLSDLTRCHYKNDTTTYQELYQIELEYNRKGRAWRG